MLPVSHVQVATEPMADQHHADQILSHSVAMECVMAQRHVQPVVRIVRPVLIQQRQQEVRQQDLQQPERQHKVRQPPELRLRELLRRDQQPQGAQHLQDDLSAEMDYVRLQRHVQPVAMIVRHVQ